MSERLNPAPLPSPLPVVCRHIGKLTQNEQIDLVTHMGRGCFYWVSHAEWHQRFPILAVLRLLRYLGLHYSTQTNQIRRGNTYGEGRILVDQPCHCIAHNAVFSF